jgi:methyl-accepting chemotaxis protein
MANIKQISESLEKLSSSSEAIASSVSEVNTTVKEIEHHATESVTLSERVVSEASEKGITAALLAMEGMERIRSRVGSLSDVINILGKRSKDIEKILTVIAEVADETTLLSLNAAILAAQAGEHGRAFAVVADEIKSLADRTSLSTKEIAALITSVQQETQSSVTMAAEGIEAVVQGLKLVGDVNEALKGIVRSSKESTEMSKAIHRSTSEESQAIRQITDAVREMSNLVERISLALQEQTNGSRFVIEQTDKMKDISSLLNKTIGEQRDGNRQIAVAIEDVAHQSEQIAGATERQKRKSSELVQFMNKIQNATAILMQSSNELNETINALRNDSRNLHGELQKFKV